MPVELEIAVALVTIVAGIAGIAEVCWLVWRRVSRGRRKR